MNSRLLAVSLSFFELLLLLFLFYVYYFFTFSVPSDIPAHAGAALNYANGTDTLPPSFLYYGVIYLFTFYSKEFNFLCLVSVYVLVFITFLKYYIVKKIFYSELQSSNVTMPYARLVSVVASFLLLIAFSLPSILVVNNYYYLGSYPTTNWHNSTSIFVMPFVVLLYWLSSKQLTSFSWKRLLLISCLIILNALVKPSYLFVYLFVYPIMQFITNKFNRHFWINLLPIVFAFFIVFLEYIFIYVSIDANDKSNSIAIQWFSFIDVVFAHGDKVLLVKILISGFIASYFFPIVLLLRRRYLLKDKMMLFAVLSCVVAYLICQSLTETGSRAGHGNLGWQMIMTNFVLFFICLLRLLELVFENTSKWKSYIPEVVAFLLHVVFGVHYLYYVFQTGGYC